MNNKKIPANGEVIKVIISNINKTKINKINNKIRRSTINLTNLFSLLSVDLFFPIDLLSDLFSYIALHISNISKNIIKIKTNRQINKTKEISENLKIEKINAKTIERKKERTIAKIKFPKL